MAKIIYSVGGELRGKIGGVVYSRNRHGAYARVKTTPTNVTTPGRALIQQLLVWVVRPWATLAPANRAEFNARAPFYTFSTSTGDTYHPSGFQLFSQMNMNAALQGLAVVNFPPATPATAPLMETNTATIDTSAKTFSIAATLIAGGGTGFIKLFVTPPVPIGYDLGSIRNRLRSLRDPITLAQVLLDTSSSPTDIAADYDAAFGTIIATAGTIPTGTAIWVSLVPVSEDNIDGAPVTFKAVIQP